MSLLSHAISNTSVVSGEGLILPLQTAIYISANKSAYMTNLWRHVVQSREKMSPFERCHFSKLLCVCVCTQSLRQRGKSSVYVVSQTVWVWTSFLCAFFIIWTDKPTEEQVLCEWIQTFSASFPFALITSAYWVLSLSVLLSLVEASEVIFIFSPLFTNPFSSRFEITVVLCKVELSKLADTWVPEI